MVGGFAVGAALAFAPLASADDLTTTVDSEISLQNSIFRPKPPSRVTPATSAVEGSTAGSFETILLTDAPQTAPFTTLDYELYGINPAYAGPASDPGSYNVFNGAVTEFADAFNC